ncbi:hypothetical protein [Tepidimonas taiwanensis]|nr:hypothetical protein [Tepidimonas taiwanensis]
MAEIVASPLAARITRTRLAKKQRSGFSVVVASATMVTDLLRRMQDDE